MLKNILQLFTKVFFYTWKKCVKELYCNKKFFKKSMKDKINEKRG